MDTENVKGKRLKYWQLMGIMGDPKITAQTDRTGKITKLPDIANLTENNLTGKPLLGSGLPTFVQAYIDWTTMPEGEHFSVEKEIVNWLDRGRIHLGNTENETKQLLKWMQENPLAVADYLDTVWVPEYSEWTTVQFRELAEQNQLRRFDL